MYLHAGICHGFTSSRCRFKSNRAYSRVNGVRKYLGKRVIDPRHQGGVRSVVAIELQTLQMHLAYAVLLYVQKQAHIGFAKPVDRLHGVAHQEQRAPIMCLPT